MATEDRDTRPPATDPGEPPHGPSDPALEQCYLEGFVDGDHRVWRLPLRPFPFRVGRRLDLELSLRSLRVSQLHAEITRQGASLRLRDLESTNGTFLNRERLEGEATLAEGDIVHFGDLEFRLVVYRPGDMFLSTHHGDLHPSTLTRRLAGETRRFLELLERRAIAAVFQPIRSLVGAELLGSEGLVRGTLPDLPILPLELFFIAESLGLEAKLSQLCRERVIGTATVTGVPGLLFVNTHPAELGEPETLVRWFRSRDVLATGPPLVLEIHEQAVTDAGRMREMRCALGEIGIGLAFDDFGAGQSRLRELVEVRPRYIKLDQSLVRDVHLASLEHRQLLRSLLVICSDLSVTAVAEGIELEAEREVCAELGFEFGQGFLLGRPLPSTPPR